MAKQYIALESTSQEILETIKGMKPKRYGYRVKISEPSPTNRVEYLYDAVGMTPASMNTSTLVFNYGSWGNIWFVRDNFPCMVKNTGVIDYKLNPADYTKKASPNAGGTYDDSDVMNVEYAGNAMSAIPCVWYRRWTEGDYYYFVCCESQYDTSYYADVHTGSDQKVHPYKLLAMFEGSLHSGKLRSLMSPGVLDSASSAKFNLDRNREATAELASAQANNPEGKSLWTLREWSSWCLIGDLLTLMSKSTNSQAAFGSGNSNGHNINDSATLWPDYNGIIEPGTLYNKGQFYASTNDLSMKVFHMENWWANRWDRLVGLVVVNGVVKVRLGIFEGEYNFTGDGYHNIGDIIRHETFSPIINADSYYERYTREMLANRYGVFPIRGGGSETTYETVYFWIRKHGVRVPLAGGACSHGGQCGSRYIACDFGAGDTRWHIGGSLSLLEPV